METDLNLDPDSNPDPESDPELITDPDPNLPIISDLSGSGCTTLIIIPLFQATLKVTISFAVVSDTRKSYI